MWCLGKTQEIPAFLFERHAVVWTYNCNWTVNVGCSNSKQLSSLHPSTLTSSVRFKPWPLIPPWKSWGIFCFCKTQTGEKNIGESCRHAQMSLFGQERNKERREGCVGQDGRGGETSVSTFLSPLLLPPPPPPPPPHLMADNSQRKK